MKRFLKTLFLFLLVLAVSVGVLALALPYNNNGYMREQELKMRMLSAAGRRPSVVLLGGSNVAFGYDSPRLSCLLHKPVINAGLHASVGLKYIIDDCLPRLRRGDILVLSPEYGHFFGLMAYGEAPMADLFYLSRGRLASRLNLRQWYSVLNNSPRYLRSKLEYTLLNALPMAKDPVYSLSAFNSSGDVVAHWGLDDRRYSEPQREPSRAEWNAPFFSYLIDRLTEVHRSGVRVVMLPPVMAATAYHNNRLNIEHTDSMLRHTPFPFIVPPSHEIYPDTMFYDTGYHLRRSGAIRHTDEVAVVLRVLMGS